MILLVITFVITDSNNNNNTTRTVLTAKEIEQEQILDHLYSIELPLYARAPSTST